MPATIHQLAAPAPEDPARRADIAALLKFVEDRAFAAGVALGEARRTGSSLPAARRDRRGLRLVPPS